jgi:hypothetical protein
MYIWEGSFYSIHFVYVNFPDTAVDFRSVTMYVCNSGFHNVTYTIFQYVYDLYPTQLNNYSHKSKAKFRFYTSAMLFYIPEEDCRDKSCLFGIACLREKIEPNYE